MGSSVPPKWFMPPAPYGSSVASNTINPVAPAAVNPQVPLLPPNFTDPGKTIQGTAQNAQSPTQNLTLGGQPGSNTMPMWKSKLPYAL